MRSRKRLTKEAWIGFRATKDEERSIDLLAKLTNTNRSVVLRRLVPDLSNAKKVTACVGA